MQRNVMLRNVTGIVQGFTCLEYNWSMVGRPRQDKCPRCPKYGRTGIWQNIKAPHFGYCEQCRTEYRRERAEIVAAQRLAARETLDIYRTLAEQAESLPRRAEPTGDPELDFLTGVPLPPPDQ